VPGRGAVRSSWRRSDVRFTGHDAGCAHPLLSLPELPEQPSLDEAGEELVGAPEPAEARREHDQRLVRATPSRIT
jgi:hypothetical protein